MTFKGDLIWRKNSGSLENYLQVMNTLLLSFS